MIKATKTTAVAEGSCNSCSERGDKVIYSVELRTLTFRVCETCREKLLKVLKEVGQAR